MSDHRQNSKVSLEDLLHLKRAERPTPEFWSNFEKELRQKQLTALVQKHRWWHDVPALLSRRIYLPAGAAAAVAFTLVAVRYNAPVNVVQVENAAPRLAAADPAIEMLPATVVAVAENKYEEPIAPSRASIEVPAARTEAAVASVPVASRNENSPSARSIAANLASLEQSEPELLNSVMGSRLSAARVQPAVAKSEPELASANESTPRYVLVARYAERALSPQPSAPTLVRERIARRLGDDLGDGASRIGVGGNRVSLKF
jgi:hypothetical protein